MSSSSGIALGPEPEGLLLRKSDVLGWARGLSEEEWDKIRPHLKTTRLPGCKKPYYRKNDIKQKIIIPLMQEE